MCFFIIIEDVTENIEYIYLFLVHLPRMIFPNKALLERLKNVFLSHLHCKTPRSDSFCLGDSAEDQPLLP